MGIDVHRLVGPGSHAGRCLKVESESVKMPAPNPVTAQLGRVGAQDAGATQSVACQGATVATLPP